MLVQIVCHHFVHIFDFDHAINANWGKNPMFPTFYQGANIDLVDFFVSIVAYCSVYRVSGGFSREKKLNRAAAKKFLNAVSPFEEVQKQILEIFDRDQHFYHQPQGFFSSLNAPINILTDFFSHFPRADKSQNYDGIFMIDFDRIKKGVILPA